MAVLYRIGNYSVLLLQEGDGSPDVACTGLLLMLVLILMLNSFVLVSMLSVPLRSNPFNASIACISAVSVLDGVFGVTTSIVFHASWSELPEQYGEGVVRKVCRMHATFLHAAGMTQSLVFAALIHDRRASLSADETRDEGAVRRRKRLQTAMTWAIPFSVLASVVTALPVGFGLFRTAMFEQRMSCSPAFLSDPPVSALAAVTISITYCATWLFTINSGVAIAKKAMTSRRRLLDVEQLARQRWPRRGSNSGEVWRRVWGPSDTADGEGLQTHILAAALTLSFLITVVPNIIAVQVTQFYRSYSTREDAYPANDTFPPTDLTSLRTDVFDSVFAWTRYGYDIFSPGIILALNRGIRKQCRTTFCLCCGSKGDFRGGRIGFNPSPASKIPRKRRKERKMADDGVPVLFSTSRGLHLRTAKDSNGEPEFVIRFCDSIPDDAWTSSGGPQRSDDCGEPEQETAASEGLPPSKGSATSETFVVKKSEFSADAVAPLGETYVKVRNTSDASADSRTGQTASIELRCVTGSDDSSQTVENPNP